MTRPRGDGRAKPEFQELVLAAMSRPPAWMTAKQVYRAMDVGSYNHIKQALHELVTAKKVRKWGPLEMPIFQRADIPEFKPDRKTLELVRQYQRDLAEWKSR
jgi:hypothetical protein